MNSVLKMRRELSIPGICKTINRGRTYVSLRLSGHEEFTPREIEMIEAAIKEKLLEEGSDKK